MRTVLVYLLLFLFISCKKQTEHKPSDTCSDSLEYVNESVGEINNSAADEDSEEYPSYDDLMLNNILVYEPRGYREDDLNKQIFSVKDTVMGLFMKKNICRLMKCRVIKVNVYEDECTGIAVYEPTLNVNDTCLFLFKGLNNLKEEVISTSMVNKKLFAGEARNFTMNGIKYTLEAKGNILSDQGKGDERWQNASNYKLFLKTNDKEQCILKIKSFADTMVTLEFAGDIDGDGKPDLILSAPDFYESVRVMLYLSSRASNGELVKLVSIKNDNFDC